MSGADGLTEPCPTSAAVPGSAALDGDVEVRLCAIPGCGRPHLARGWCRPHYVRWQRHGDPLAEVPIRERARGSGGSSAWSVLRQVRAERGSAAARTCAGCGGAAAVWSYDGTDSDERTLPGRSTVPSGPDDPHADVGGGAGPPWRYSLDPARYRSLCRFCHRRAVLDRAAPVPEPARRAPAMDSDRAARLYAAGASAAGIAGLLHVSPDAVLRALRSRGITIRAAHSNDSGPFPRATRHTRRH
ncbi:MAG: hypothetical protein ACRDRK_17880 [Pseudonocardia sp.]